MAATNQNPINTPQTWAQIQAEAEQQAAAQIQGTVAPLQGQITTLTGQETSAHKAIGDEFAALMPGVQASAGRVEQAYGGALQAEQSIFAAAGTRMNQLHQQQAQEAQQLAQQMGGPVTTGQFTQNLAPYEQALGSEAPAALLDTLGRAQTGVQQAESFAGQVFPALQTEQQANSDNYYKNQIKGIQDQIAQAQAGKSTLTQSKLTDLLNQERQFKLQLAQQKLDKTKASRDWKVQQASLNSQKLRDALAKRAAKQAGVRLSQSQQRINIEAQHVTAEERLQAQRLGLSVAEFKQRQAHEQQSAKVGQARLSLSASKDAASVVDTAMNGGKPTSVHQKIYIPKGSTMESLAQVGKGGTSYWDPKKKQYYKIASVSVAGGQELHPVHDPNRLYDLVRGTIPQLGRKATINLVRAKTGLKGWVPGKNMTYTGAQLHDMALSELVGLARDSGYKGPLGKKANRQAITDFILHASR
jgi:hypothetical protein